MVKVAIAEALWNVGTPALVDSAWTVAYSASVKLAHTVVFVVTDAIHVFVSGANTAADSQYIFLVTVAIAKALRKVNAPTLVDGARSVTYAALIDISNAVIHVVADFVLIDVFWATSPTYPNGIEV